MLRIMSNNQWKVDDNCPYWAERGLDCSAKVREAGFAKLYKALQPDIIGLQEVSAVMADELMRALKKSEEHYALLWGRDTPILYRPDKLEILDCDYFIYPKAIPGLDGDFNNEDTKSYCIALFRHKDTGRMLTFMSTHLWWKSDDPASSYYQPNSEKARTYQIGFAIKHLDEMAAAYNSPSILVGDLNTRYQSSTIRFAIEKGYSHAHNMATQYTNEEHGMHPCGPAVLGPYIPMPFSESIDHILLKGFPQNAVLRFERYSMPADYLVLSDHAPVWIDLDW